MKKILEIKNLTKTFGRKGYESVVLKDVAMDIYRDHGAKRSGKIYPFESAVHPGQTLPRADHTGRSGCDKGGKQAALCDPQR